MRKSKITPEERELMNSQPQRREAVRPPVPRMAAPKPRKRKQQEKPQPGYDGGLEVGARVVDDPYEPGAKITVPANVRHDPLARMYHAKEIDEGQYLAGEKFRHCLEKIGGAGAPCADWTRPFVDKSISHREPVLTDKRAWHDLRQAHALLGWQNYRLVQGIVFDGLNGSLIAQAKGDLNDRKHIKRAVRDSLEQLAIMWRFLSGPEHERKYASIVAYLNEIPSWGHEEKEIQIEYRQKGKAA